MYSGIVKVLSLSPRSIVSVSGTTNLLFPHTQSISIYYHTVVTPIALMALVSYVTHVWEPSQLTKHMLKTINISWKWKVNAKLRNKYTDGNIVKVSDTLIDNILVQFNGGICQLSRGILMRRNCEHIFPICFCFFLFFMNIFNHVCLKDKNTKLRTFKYHHLATHNISSSTLFLRHHIIIDPPCN